MILSDRDILRRINDKELVFAPDIDVDIQVQSASIDLRLARGFFVENKEAGLTFDPTSLDGTPLSEAFKLYHDRDRIELEPGQYIMAQTLEHVWIPIDTAGRVEGKSSIARMGLTVHNTAPHINPGWDGQITLEIANHGPIHVVLVAEMPICQLILHELKSAPSAPYKGTHSGQRSPVD